MSQPMPEKRTEWAHGIEWVRVPKAQWDECSSRLPAVVAALEAVVRLTDDPPGDHRDLEHAWQVIARVYEVAAQALAAARGKPATHKGYCAASELGLCSCPALEPDTPPGKGR